MNYNSELMKKLAELARNAAYVNPNQEADNLKFMDDVNYIRQSSQLVKDALQNGHDIVQMPNGDIITTSLKVSINEYSWDDNIGAMALRNVNEKDISLPDLENISINHSAPSENREFLLAKGRGRKTKAALLNEEKSLQDQQEATTNSSAENASNKQPSEQDNNRILEDV